MSFICPCPGVIAFSALFLGQGHGGTSFALPFGVEDQTRILVAAVMSQAATPPSACAINGNAMTLRANAGPAKIFTLPFSVGTSGTVALSGSSSGTLNAVGLYALYGLSSDIPFGTATGATSTNVNVPAGGFAIGGFTAGSPGAWTGLNQDFSAPEFTSASKLYAAAQTPLAVSNSGSASPALAAASWGA